MSRARVPSVRALFGAAWVAALACTDSGSQPRYDYATTCRVGQDVRPAGAIALVDAFAGTTFDQPIAMAHFADGSGRLAIAERAGRVRVVIGRAGEREITTALDIHDKVYTGGECGFLGIAIDPADNTKLYAHYCTQRDGRTLSVIAEWTNFGDERVLIEVEQPWDNHNGGGLAFGPDGHLYIGFGDGGSQNDPRGAGQDLDVLLGKVLRVDPRGATPYAIPADNPFAADGGRPEIYAWGFRNPWRLTFDRETGELYVGDVGQNTLEEIDLVERGKNYGWNIMEGDGCRGGGDSCNTNDLELPIITYDRDTGVSVTGGYVYRGADVPLLVGRYVYGDFASRSIFSWRAGEPSPTVAMLTFEGGLASFGEDEAGELYALDLERGRIFRFAQGVGAPSSDGAPPGRLSETGCFTDLAGLAPAVGVLPYTLALPFWSDGADKQRFVVLPEGGRVVMPEGEAFGFPIGTVFIKHFELKGSRVETRFLIQEPIGVRGFTYRWEGDDAVLMDGGARFEVAGQEWQLPSPTDCTMCHRGQGVLGIEARQLGAEAAAWRGLGIVQGVVPRAEVLVTPTSAAPLPARARAWLHVNCSACHDGSGPSGTALDLRVDAVDLAACDEAPQRGDLGIADARIIAPGDAERSVLWRRIATREQGAMPPLASGLVDPDADVVRAWIAELEGCP